jgi:hypothetical protein
VATVYLAGIGFRPEGMRLVGPVTVTRGRWTLALRELIATAGGTELRYHVIGLEGDEGHTPKQDVVAIRFDGAERVLQPGGFSLGFASVGVNRRLVSTTTLPRWTGPIEVRITIDGVGEFDLSAELKEFGPETDAVRFEANASTTHEGVTILVRGVGAAREETALEIEAEVDGGGTCAGIGGLHGMRHGPTTLTLRDDKGQAYAERWHEPGRSESATFALFEPLHPGAREIELAVPYVFVEERMSSAAVGLSTLPAATSLGAYPVRVVGLTPLDTAKATDADSRPLAKTLAIDLDLGGWLGDRRILRPGTVLPNCGWRSMRYGPTGREPEPITRVEISGGPTLAVTAIRLADPLIQIRGPWRIRFPLAV